MSNFNPKDTKLELETKDGKKVYYSITKLQELSGKDVSRLPFSINILLENVLRNFDGKIVNTDDIEAIADWGKSSDPVEVPYKPSRVILQDFTGVPCVVDLAAMRGVVNKMGLDPAKINPIVPVDLVIDHSVQVDHYATPEAFMQNVEREYERNGERYAFLRWAQQAFENFRVVPPGTGIVHQVNLEYLASVVASKEIDGDTVVFPDTLVGTDSHTTMINGLAVMGWGVGGIEAEACMLGQPLYMLMPDVIGFKLHGQLSEGVTATDMVLTITEMLRKKGVVGKFVEFFGPGLTNMSLADRATISNMAPEYGATMGFFPVDDETLRYLRVTGRSEELIDVVEKYTNAQGLFRTDDMPDPIYTDTLELDLSDVVPSLAGPSRPQDRISLNDMKSAYHDTMKTRLGDNGDLHKTVDVQLNGADGELSNGSVVISAITSCTNTSNPSVMIGAGLVAKKAVEKGLSVSPTVKTSLAPGSKVVTDYLEDAGLNTYLDKLGFNLVGYGCTTCIGNSGPLPEAIESAIKENDFNCASVLSGNRNFEGRVHPFVKLSYLASPPLVVAYALAGTVDIDLSNDPIGTNDKGEEVYLKDIWPTQQEVREVIEKSVTPEIFNKEYEVVFEGDDKWKSMESPTGNLYKWNDDSTYVQEPPFFEDFGPDTTDPQDIKGAYVYALLGDSITTDHISPAGSIPKDGPAGKFLISKGVDPYDFNSFGSRRGNHDIMMRGTFANIRIKNKLLPGTEGGVTKYIPGDEDTTMFEASEKYRADGTPLIVIGGKEYGTGSSRDWAAKGTFLLGVKAVITESFERIHRSNLVGMGVLPLQFKPGDSAESLGITGFEKFDIEGISDLSPRKELSVTATDNDGNKKQFNVICRLDSPVEIDYIRNGGILQTVLRQMISAN
ncbi:MAG: aconitate hydratase AcnA [Candidatus Dadabacteria bacterium]|nr:aconitate hydratase AcnA [Candidatus Dadabacteria bacterium]NIS09608.1 aconitate hydratase AcnA [Candidatus Dadabacteria bacterium]NIY22783.1 aconitate hydratase AcnA [Candidatus Dadabacteria bacterium]